MLEPRQVERIAERLDARFGLDALWVFGSVARGTATAASAVDVAALFGRRPAPLDLLDARRRPRCSPGCAVVDRDVVTAKIATIDRCLERIVTRHLGDLREFSARILARYGL